MPRQSRRNALSNGAPDKRVGKDPASSGRALDPVPSQQPYLSDLRKSHVAEQREHKDGPVQPRQVREAQRGGQRGIRQQHANGHAGSRCCCRRPTRSAVQERNVMCTNDVYDELLPYQRPDEPAGLKQRRSRWIPAVEDPEHDEESRIVENRTDRTSGRRIFQEGSVAWVAFQVLQDRVALNVSELVK